jgi:hypothetical protein
MNAQDKDSGFVNECKVTVTESGFEIAGHFRCIIPRVGDDHALGSNELDHIEQHVEQLGQQFKRVLCRQTLEAADTNYTQLLQKTQPHFHKNGKPPFTIIAKCGRITIKRQCLRNTQTGKTMIPSAIVWETSQNQHVTHQVVEAACDASQEVSYRKAAKQLAEESGEEQLISTSTVWNKKQLKGKELQQKQNDLIEQALPQPKQDMPSIPIVPSCSKTTRIASDTIQAQLDEVVTKSQEHGKKTNLTYTATLETSDGECYHFAESSSQKVIHVVMAQLMMLGLLLGKRLEVISDGARWISDWAKSIKGVEVEHILCWWHLSKRVYEGLSGLGLAKDKRKQLEREILGDLWRGETAQAVWLLWGLRKTARVPQRIDDLMGYLLRKKHVIVNYAARREQGLWLASTRVEKWNDVAVSERCKHRGMSWSEQGVLAVALYAAEQKRKSNKMTTQTAQLDANCHTSV